MQYSNGEENIAITEIQNIRIPLPLSELVKHEDFEKSLSKLLQFEPYFHSTDSINLQVKIQFSS
jgi:hypothetical protein